jgi:hypothetical protein
MNGNVRGLAANALGWIATIFEIPTPSFNGGIGIDKPTLGVLELRSNHRGRFGDWLDRNDF